MRPNPPQGTAGVRMPLAQPDLPQRRSSVGPEVVADKPNGSVDESLLDSVRLGNQNRLTGCSPRPIKVCQRTGQPQNLCLRFRPPLALAPIERSALVVDEGAELLKLLTRLWR